uniref:Uncharacterized protein n=1 Tax=Trichuris muris TaxID=70415 RepID=A0A5S6QB62_TRIMR
MNNAVLPAEKKQRTVATSAYLTQREMESQECKWYTDHVECPARLKPCDPEEEEVPLFRSRKYVKGIASTASMEN